MRGTRLIYWRNISSFAQTYILKLIFPWTTRGRGVELVKGLMNPSKSHLHYDSWTDSMALYAKFFRGQKVEEPPSFSSSNYFRTLTLEHLVQLFMFPSIDSKLTIFVIAIPPHYLPKFQSWLNFDPRSTPFTCIYSDISLSLLTKFQRFCLILNLLDEFSLQ